MEIIFHNKFEDLHAYSNFFLKHTKEGKKYSNTILIFQQIAFILVSVLAGIVFWLISGNFKDGVIFFVIILFLVEFMYLYKSNFEPRTFYAKSSFRKQIDNMSSKEKQMFLMPKKCTVIDDFFQIESEKAKHQWAWDIIDDIKVTADFLLVMVNKQYFYMIPRRDFLSEQDFLDFSNSILKKSKAISTDFQDEIAMPIRQESKKLKKVAFITIFLLLGISLCLGLGLWYGGGNQIFVDSKEIPVVIDAFMKKMMLKDVTTAASYFYNGDDETVVTLSEQINSIDYALYADYQSVEITVWNLQYAGDNGEAEIAGKILYSDGFQGQIFASLITLDGKWVITDVSLYAPPAKIENYIKEYVP
jgi:hypothetical protein